MYSLILLWFIYALTSVLRMEILSAMRVEGARFFGCKGFLLDVVCGTALLLPAVVLRCCDNARDVTYSIA